MNKLRGTCFIATVLAVAVAATFMGYAKADAQWEAQWQQTLEAAKKEGKVVLYGSSVGPVVRKQAAFFKKKFGFDLDVSAGRGGQFVQKVRSEMSAGLNVVDVIMAGGEPVVSFKQMGLTGPMDHTLILPEVTDTKLFYTLDRHPWYDEAKHLFYFLAYPNRDITINTDLIKPGEITSWQDLLKPQYKGKIVWSDPSVPGSGLNGVSTNLMNKVTTEGYYRKLVATQDVTMSRNLRQMAEWLARGKYPIAVSVPGTPISEMVKAGAKIGYVRVKEGAYLSYDGGILGVSAKAPHPNAAKVFVNWFLSKEGQAIVQEATKYQSVRNDIPTEGIVNKDTMRVPGEKYFQACNTDEKCVLQEVDKNIALIKDLFGPLIGK